MGTPEKTDASQLLQPGFRLEALEIDPQTGVVCGPGGREKLNPKVMDVLVMMTRHPRQVVTDDAVTRCFYLLRRQLSQAGGDSHYRTLIETLPKRGYRLNGEIGSSLPVPPVAAPGVERHRPWAIAFVVFAAIAMIAVSI